MQLNVSFDQSVLDGSNFNGGVAEQTAFENAVCYVADYYSAIFTNPVAITIDVGYGEIGAQFGYGGQNGSAVTAIGESDTVLNGTVGGLYIANYGDVRSALLARNVLGADTLPSTPPSGSPATLAISPAEAIALDLLPDTNNVVGVVGFSSAPNIFGYALDQQPASDEYYFIGVVEHEFSEVLGRTSLLTGVNESGINTPAYSLMDLFRYSAPGVRDFSIPAPPPYTDAYFSIDNGTTPLDDWNTNPGSSSDPQDLGDWAPSAGNDAFDDGSPQGVINAVTPADLTLMNVLGWDVAASWNDGVSGDFAAGANWNTGFVPDSTIGAILGAPGSYTVSSSENNTVGSLSVRPETS